MAWFDYIDVQTIAIIAIAMDLGVALGGWLEGKVWKSHARVKPRYPVYTRDETYYVLTEEDYIKLTCSADRRDNI